MRWLAGCALLACVSACDKAATASAAPEPPAWGAIADPGRGFYHHTERRSANEAPPELSVLRTWRAEGTTLVMRVFYLSEFLERDLSNAWLEAVDRDFAVIRDGGMKSVIRFAYSSNMDDPDGRQAGMDRVLGHIGQMKPVLRANADVLHCVQAGFIGAWGEWHAAHRDFKAEDGSLCPESCRRVMSALLDAVPEPVFLQLRTPWQKLMLFGQGEAGADRVGQHNDCFLASDDDVGTYRDREGEMLWLEDQTLRLPMGGETCGVNPPRSGGASALREMARFHYNFLNADYHPGVLRSWREDGSYDEIAARLGHRIRLVGVESAGGALRLTLLNEGFAAPLYERVMEVRDAAGVVVEVAGFSMRAFAPGEARVIELPGAALPLDVRWPDPAERLRERPEYATRLANPRISMDDTGWQRIVGSLELKK